MISELKQVMMMPRVTANRTSVVHGRKFSGLFPWVNVFRINPEFRILRLTFHRKSASK